MNEENNKKDIEVVQGMGNLDISPVYENTTVAKPKMKDEKPTNIVIPEVKKSVDKKEEESNLEDELNDIVEDDEVLDESEYDNDNSIEFEDVDLDDDVDEADTENE